uniref:PIK helical domain-containing protein n=1 Tax=Acrobeloides nanus TaxID=290746 RepID=A0A914D6D4_9BILA
SALDASKRLSTLNDLSPTSAKSFAVQHNLDEKTVKKIDEYFGNESDLASFLIRAAIEDSVIANFLYWYLKVEIEANSELDEPMSKMYAGVLDRLTAALSQGSNSTRRTYQMLISQKKFVETLVEMAKLVAEVSGNRMKKQEVLKRKLAENSDLIDLKGLSLPLDPSIHVKNVDQELEIAENQSLAELMDTQGLAESEEEETDRRTRT